MAVDLDWPLHALADLVGEVDVEALDAAFEARHGMRRERAVDSGLERLLGDGKPRRERHGQCRCSKNACPSHGYSLS